MLLGDRDIVLVTLDSCRYDAAVAANTPHLERLGPVVKAETSGTYTLPAHTAFFTGNLPKPVDQPYQIGDMQVASIWRSAAARTTPQQIAIPFDGQTLMHHYRKQGFRAIGAGGVTFFDPAEPNNWLPGLFDEFHYYGRQNRTAMSGRVVDRSDGLTLAHVDELAERCHQTKRFFMFINCPSTHVPYTTPKSLLTSRATDALTRLYELHDSKQHRPKAFSPDETLMLLEMQVSALEWADQQLGQLFDQLAHRRPLVVVCADHGEEFGDGGRYGHGHASASVTTVPLWCGLLGEPRR
jgi:arylsulfatase A-like enzyme